MRIGLSGYFVGRDNLHDVLEQEIASSGPCGPRIWENPKIRGTLSGALNKDNLRYMPRLIWVTGCST